MVGILPLAIALMFGSYIDDTEAMDFHINLNLDTINHEEVNRQIEERHRQEQEHQRALEAANHLTEDDYNRVINNRRSDLMSINSIFKKQKPSFDKMRTGDHNDQWVRFGKTKVDQLFGVNLYAYEHNRNLRHLVSHIFNSIRNTSTNKEEKLNRLEHKIGSIKNTMVYFRDLCERKCKNPEDGEGFIAAFNLLYHFDIQLAIHKKHRDWENYKAFLEAFEDF